MHTALLLPGGSVHVPKEIQVRQKDDVRGRAAIQNSLARTATVNGFSRQCDVV